MKVACVVLICLLGTALANPLRRLKNKRGYSFVKKAIDMHKQKRGLLGPSPSWGYMMRNSSCVDADAIEDQYDEFEQAIEDGYIEEPKTAYDLAAAVFRGILGTPASCFQDEDMVEVCQALGGGMKAMIESHVKMDVAIFKAKFLAENPEVVELMEELGVESLEELAELLESQEDEEGSGSGPGGRGPGGRGPGGNGPRPGGSGGNGPRPGGPRPGGGSGSGSGEGGPGRGGPPRDGPPRGPKSDAEWELPDPCLPPAEGEILSWLQCEEGEEDLATLPYIQQLKDDMACYLDHINNDLKPNLEGSDDAIEVAVNEQLEEDSIPTLTELTSGLDWLLKAICDGIDAEETLDVTSYPTCADYVEKKSLLHALRSLMARKYGN